MSSCCDRKKYKDCCVDTHSSDNKNSCRYKNEYSKCKKRRKDYCVDTDSSDSEDACRYKKKPKYSACNKTPEPKVVIKEVIKIKDVIKEVPLQIKEFVPTGTDTVSHNDSMVCIICMENDKCCMMNPCSHLCMCIACSQLLESNVINKQFKCPICRTDVEYIKKVFF